MTREVLHAPSPDRARRRRRRRTGPGTIAVDRRQALAERSAAGCARSAARVRVAGRLATAGTRRGRRRADRPAPTASRRTGPSRRCRAASRPGLREPYMSLCQRGSIVSSAPRRSNCTGCSRQFSPFCGRGPPSPIPSTGCSSSLNDRLPSSSKTISCTAWPLAFVTTTVSGLGRTSTLSAPTRTRRGRVSSRSSAPAPDTCGRRSPGAAGSPP